MITKNIFRPDLFYPSVAGTTLYDFCVGSALGDTMLDSSKFITKHHHEPKHYSPYSSSIIEPMSRRLLLYRFSDSGERLINLPRGANYDHETQSYKFDNLCEIIVDPFGETKTLYQDVKGVRDSLGRLIRIYTPNNPISRYYEYSHDDMGNPVVTTYTGDETKEPTENSKRYIKLLKITKHGTFIIDFIRDVVEIKQNIINADGVNEEIRHHYRLEKYYHDIKLVENLLKHNYFDDLERHLIKNCITMSTQHKTKNITYKHGVRNEYYEYDEQGMCSFWNPEYHWSRNKKEPKDIITFYAHDGSPFFSVCDPT